MQGIEWSGADMALFLFLAAVVILTPAVAGAFVGRWLYRKRTPPAQQTRSGAVRSAVIGAAFTFVGVMIIRFLSALVSISMGG